MKGEFTDFIDLGKEYEGPSYDGEEKKRISYPHLDIYKDDAVEASPDSDECIAMVKLKRRSYTERLDDDGETELSACYDVKAIAFPKKAVLPDYIKPQNGGGSLREAFLLIKTETEEE